MNIELNIFKRLTIWVAVLLVWTSQQTHAQKISRTNDHPLQIGVVLHPSLLQLPSGPGSFYMPRALTFKHRFNPKNSFNVFLVYGAGDGLTDYGNRSTYWFSGFNVHAGYEHWFFSSHRVNMLAGVKFGYTYSREVLPEFRYSNVSFPSLAKFHSRFGPGIDLGAHVKLNNRLALESYISVLHSWPSPYNEPFNAWLHKGNFSLHRMLSLDLCYRFGDR
jgi:hypothetical protein